MKRAKGQPWESTSQADVQRARTLDGIGHAFALLHNVEMAGYGPLTPDQGGSYPTWSSWLLADLIYNIQPLVQEGYVPPDFMSITKDVVKALEPELDKVPPSLVHGDLGDREVFVDPVSGALTEIVDWGDALSGDSRYDFAGFVAGGPADDERPARYLPGVKQAYTRYSRCAPSFLDAKVTYLYELHNTVRNAFWCISEEPSWIEDLCAHAVSLVSKLR
jgi:aminoglycoside phosphotransferase (APT) family kinase protein